MRSASIHMKMIGDYFYPVRNRCIQRHVYLCLKTWVRGQILWTEKMTLCAGHFRGGHSSHFKVIIYRCKKKKKSYNSIIETVP